MGSLRWFGGGVFRAVFRSSVCLPLVAACLVAVVARGGVAAESDRPNFLVIVADDLGYADLGVQGGKDVPTPNIDALAAGGMRFTNGYTSGCVCSPTRVGIVTGRYQQRTGHDANPHRGFGLAMSEMTIASLFERAGYVTGMVGKWHLGEEAEEVPTARGFDEFYGLLPHGIGAGGEKGVPVLRQTEVVATPADHTVAFGDEAVAFIERHQADPFFLYLPFTAVHAPHLSPEEYQSRFAHVADPSRRRYVAMLALLDDTVGRVMAELRRHDLEERTLVFFISDNGGPTGAPDNGPLRGGKWSLWEGGIRVPFFIQWKGHVPAGAVCDELVIQLDMAPTMLAAAGISAPAEAKLDGVNLLPLLEGESQRLERDSLFWRFGVQFAARQGDWKLVKPSLADEPMLFNLADDVGESRDLAGERPDKVAELTALWNEWNAGNIAPRWDDARWNGLDVKQADRAKAKAAKNKTKKKRAAK